MFIKRILGISSCLTAVLFLSDASAWQYRDDKFTVRLTGYVDGGLIEPDFETPLFIGDWRGRAQVNYAVTETNSIGLVYSLDAQRVDEDEYITDLFALWENRDFGRIEFGMTESIGEKLGLGLPDVSGMRINDNPIFYNRISPDGTVISDTTLDTGHDALRVNLATRQINSVQYGLSVSGLTDNYKFAVDAAAKIRQPQGKLKTALSFAASFMDSPDGFHQETYSYTTTADWRIQGTVGLNLQYNSFIFGATFRGIYDQNPIGTITDGIAAGAGVSYDLLKYSVSLSYLMSDTGIWHKDAQNYMDNTVISSLRYKYSENVAGWLSLGYTTKTPFVAAGIRLSF